MDQIQRVNKVRKDEVKEYHIDQNTEWLRAVLIELLEDNGLGDKEVEGSAIDLTVRLDKEHFEEYGEVLFCEGKIRLKYQDISVQTGDVICQELEIPIYCAFLEKHNEKKHQLEEEITIFFDDQEWDLYYHNKNQVDFLPVVHEYVFLNKNPYPGISNE